MGTERADSAPGAKAYLATGPGLGQTELWAATPRHRNAVAFLGAATAAGLGPGGQVSCLLFLPLPLGWRVPHTRAQDSAAALALGPSPSNRPLPGLKGGGPK